MKVKCVVEGKFRSGEHRKQASLSFSMMQNMYAYKSLW
jgi:hypothetical protein